MNLSFTKLKQGGGSQPAGRGNPARTNAPRMELLWDQDVTKAVALGLQWRTVATAGGRDDAVKLARQAGATHYLYRGQQVAFGTVAPDIKPDARVFPAALTAARQHAGSFVVAMQVGNREYWVALILNGAPTSTDLFLRDTDDAEVLAKVREIIAGQHVSGLLVYTNLAHHGLENTRPYWPEDLVAAPNGDAERLLSLPKAGMAIPKPVLAVLVAVLVVAALQEGWKRWQGYQRSKQLAEQQMAEANPQEAWADAIRKWESAISLPRGDGLVAPRASMDKLPVIWYDWNLVQATCTAQPPVVAVAERVWTCAASYQRTATGALNRDMVVRVPAGWTVAFSPLNGLQATWSVKQQIRPMNLAALRPQTHYIVESASRLQRLQPSMLAEIPMSFAPEEITAPRKRDGTALPTPPEAEGIVRASLNVKGPLRSVDALIAADIEADWRVISISFEKQLQGTVNKSAVMVEVTGELYAKR